MLQCADVTVCILHVYVFLNMLNFVIFNVTRKIYDCASCKSDMLTCRHLKDTGFEHFAEVCILKASFCRNFPESASDLDRYHHIVSTGSVQGTGLKCVLFMLSLS